jgi:hypothetical protein
VASRRRSARRFITEPPKLSELVHPSALAALENALCPPAGDGRLWDRLSSREARRWLATLRDLCEADERHRMPSRVVALCWKCEPDERGIFDRLSGRYLSDRQVRTACDEAERALETLARLTVNAPDGTLPRQAARYDRLLGRFATPLIETVSNDRSPLQETLGVLQGLKRELAERRPAHRPADRGRLKERFLVGWSGLRLYAVRRRRLPAAAGAFFYGVTFDEAITVPTFRNRLPPVSR